MAALVLPPHDVLRDAAHHQRRRLISPSRSNPRRSTPTKPENTRSSRRKQRSATGSPTPPQSNPILAKSPGLSGQIRILKRGEELPPKVPTKPPPSAETTPKTKSKASVYPANMAILNPIIDGFFAGSAFSTSPPPSSLPVPVFCGKTCGRGLTLSSAEDVAVDLRRILRLEL